MINFKELSDTESSIDIAGLLEFILILAYAKSDMNIALALPSYTAVKEMMGKIKDLDATVPDWIKPGTIRYTNNVLQFDNGSKIILASSPHQLKGITLNVAGIHNDLTDIIEWKETMWPALFSQTKKLIYFL